MQERRNLHLDFETRSRLDIKKVGLDSYARNCKAILLAWAIDDGYVHVAEHLTQWIDILDTRLVAALVDPTVVKVAWNCGFEQAILSHCLGVDVPNDQWLDVAVVARYCSLPGQLAACGEALGLEAAQAKKKAAGTRLINKFSKPTKTGEFRNQTTDPQDWALFVDYCRQDVIAERAILHKLRHFMLPPQERSVYLLDQKINQEGLPVNMEFVSAAKSIVSVETARLMQELKALTGLANPNSPKQLLSWLRDRGYPFGSLGAAKIRDVLTSQTNEVTQ